MKFEMVMKANATLKKKKHYDLNDITEEDLEKAMEHSFENPYIKKGTHGIYELYPKDDQVVINRYLAFYQFVRVK